MEFIFKRGSGFKLKIGPTGLFTILAVLELIFGQGYVVSVPVDVIGTVVMAALQ